MWPPHDPAAARPLPEPCSWDQRTDEALDAFEAFAAWLTLEDPREYAWTAATRRWAQQHRWRARRAAYVQSLAATSSRAGHEKAADMGARHAEALRSLFDLGMETLSRLEGRELSPRDALAAVKMALEFERLRAGEPGQIQRHDLGTVSDEALEALDQALEAVEREGRA